MMKNKNISTGISFGVIIGLVYVLFLFWRWSSAGNMIQFGIIAVFAYLVVLGIMCYEAYYRRKENGGYIDLKSLFQTLFVSVIIFELIYALYNFIHLKYIDPDVVSRMKVAMREVLDKAGEAVSDDDKEKTIDKLDELNDAGKFSAIIKNYFTSLATSGVFALLISLVFRKKKPVFQEIQ